jgi:hypothetical protein
MCFRSYLTTNSTGGAVWQLVVKLEGYTVELDGYNVKDAIHEGDRVWEATFGGCRVDERLEDGREWSAVNDL